MPAPCTWTLYLTAKSILPAASAALLSSQVQPRPLCAHGRGRHRQELCALRVGAELPAQRRDPGGQHGSHTAAVHAGV